MHNNDFDILLRSLNYSAKLQIAKKSSAVQWPLNKFIVA